MGTITGLTAERMEEIENSTIVNAAIIAGELIFYKNDGTPINAGSVGGVPGPPGDSVAFLDPGESSAGYPNGTKICRRYS